MRAVRSRGRSLITACKLLPLAAVEMPTAARTHELSFFTSPRGNGMAARSVLCALLVGITVWAGKAVLISTFATSVPFNDQWDAEAELLYAPLVRSQFSWHAIVTPHNEHRIVPTQLLNVALFELNGRRWEPRLQMLVSAAIHAACFALLAAWCLSRIPSRPWRFVFVVALLVLGVVPFSYENTLWGFQSQIYFCLLFGLMACWGAGFHRPNTARWWLGIICALLAMFSFGGGALTGIALIVAALIPALTEKNVHAVRRSTLLGGLGMLLLGLVARSTITQQDALGCGDWLTFAFAILRLLSWPVPIYWWAGIVVWAPLGILTVRILTGREPKGSSPLPVAVVLAAFAGANILAVAFFRGNDVARLDISPRYQDVLAVGTIANLLGLIALLSRTPIRWKRATHYVAAIWVILVAGCVIARGVSLSTTMLPFWRQAGIEQATRLRSFLDATDDSGREESLRNTTFWQRGYPDAERLASILRTAGLRAALPRVLQGKETETRPHPLETVLESVLASAKAVFAIALIALVVVLCLPSNLGNCGSINFALPGSLRAVRRSA